MSRNKDRLTYLGDTCHLDKHSFLSLVSRSTPLGIGESRIAGGSCKRIYDESVCLKKEEGNWGEGGREVAGKYRAGLNV